MTLSEFKAWLDGYGAAIQGAPTEEQWGVIQKKLDEVIVTHPAPVVIPSTWPGTSPSIPSYPYRIGEVTCETGRCAGQSNTFATN